MATVTESRISIDGEDPHVAVLVPGYGRNTMRLSGHEHDVALTRLEGGRAEVTVDGAVVPVHLVRRGDIVHVHAFDRTWEVEIHDESDHGAGGPSAVDSVLAPMPGTVVSLDCEPGQTVTAGQVLVVIESMKMQSELVSPRDGVVDRVLVGVGDSFDRDAALVVLMGEDEED